MGKIKIHELAKEIGMSSKDVLEKAKSLGIDVTSHLSNVTDEQATEIRNAYSKNNKNNVKKENKVENKKETKKETKTKRIEKIINSTLGYFTKEDIRELCPDIPEPTINRVFNNLRKDGKIEVVARGRSAKWKRV